jgi:serine/threonine-protein kinase
MPTETSDASPKLSQLSYLVSSIIGSGAGGTVMLITDKSPGGRRYALRVIKREEEADDLTIEKARAEFEGSQKANHPAVLKCHDFRLKRSWFQVSRAEQLMELVEGKTLDTIESIDIEPGIAIFARAAAGLAHLHRRGVYHGDVRPAHILLSRNGQVKVRKYGLSLVQAKFKDQLKLGGSFIAPEQTREKKIDAQTDLYGLGATMYQVLTGRPPGGGIMGRTEGKKLSTPISLNPKIPGPLNTLIIACLQLSADKRPPDMYEAVKQLDMLVKEMSIGDDCLRGIAVGES